MNKELPSLKSTRRTVIPKDRLPHIEAIDEEAYGAKKKGYQIGTEHNNISGGYNKYMEDVTPFLQIHSDDLDIGDFNKRLYTLMGELLIKGNGEGNNIDVSHKFSPPFNKLPNSTYKLYNYYNMLKGITSGFDNNRPKDAIELFPIFPKIVK